MCNITHRLVYLNPWSQLIVLLGEVIGYLGGGAPLEEGGLRFHSLASFLFILCFPTPDAMWPALLLPPCLVPDKPCLLSL